MENSKIKPWKREFDERWPSKLYTVIDREITEEQRRILFGPNSEYFGSLKSFIENLITQERLDERRKVVEEAKRIAVVCIDHDSELIDVLRELQTLTNPHHE